ncbi:hypothetical protein BX661DRAFT_185958 [Kickxella alabastrina]|uniref:uncharacterized protein n=1 Tax=Kickxella alabastrina TaxID=61397 RepID=UPI00221F78FF|nr:uncharacterized protein BX661DRAFT_185958 [Kickxella alabastrina]KAI7823934.1 hypothetical protein BX661DRAFT_185958 [Kickxella alabastrina]
MILLIPCLPLYLIPSLPQSLQPLLILPLPLMSCLVLSMALPLLSILQSSIYHGFLTLSFIDWKAKSRWLVSKNLGLTKYKTSEMLWMWSHGAMGS